MYEFEVVGDHIACHEHKLLITLRAKGIVVPNLVWISAWFIVTLYDSVRSAVFQEDDTSVGVISFAIDSVERCVNSQNLSIVV